MKKATKKPVAKKPAKKKVVEPEPVVEVVEPIPEPVPEPIPEPIPEPVPELVPEPEPVKAASIEEIAQRAWNAVRAKDDADFAHCEPSFRGNLLYHAQGVKNSFKPLTGDTVLARFEQEVKKQILGG